MRVILTVVTFLYGYSVLAQGNAKITGTVMDSVSRQPVEFATVALIDERSDKPVDGTVCDEKGGFSLNRVAPGDYRLTITFIGFQTKLVRVKIDDKKDGIDLGTILISPVPQMLQAVTVEGQKSLIEERVDRMVYNAENDATTKGGDATDVLRRVPMLTVDMDGNVSLRGNQNILVLINNKPSTIVAGSVSDALQQIPADEIKSVEVITSPSAKYDAEGSAGIINIITKKNVLEGATLNVDMGVGLRGSNLGLRGNYRKNKMGFTLGGWGRANYNVTGSFENSQRALNTETLNVQRADTRRQGVFGNYNLGWDYDINEKNSLAASVRFGVRNNRDYQDDLLTQQFSNGNIIGSSLRDVFSKGVSNNISANFSYTHLYDKPQQELSILASYGRNNRNSNFENFIKDELDFSTISRFKNVNDSYDEELTIQADYISPIGTNQMIEFGAKEIMRKVFSDFTSYNATGADGEYIPSTNERQSNNLNYDQNVIAGYFSYTLTTSNAYSFKAGARYEYTTINAYTKTEDNIDIPSYGVFVPSINASRKLKNGNMLKASYNRRIQRPSIRFLNPNIESPNPLDITVGNPRLDPEYTNNYELSYSTFIKGVMLNASVFVRNTNDAIQSVRDVIANNPADADTIQTTYANIGLENAYGTSLFMNLNIGKFSLNGGADIFYSMADNKSPQEQYRASNEGWVASGRMFGSYNFGKGWAAQFFGFVRGRRIQLQGYQGGFRMYNLGIRKEFNEKRGSIGLSVENFLTSSMKIRTRMQSPILEQRNVNTMNNMSFRVNFSYRIGKMSADGGPRRRGRSIENDDLKDGGGDMNGMGMDGAQGFGGQSFGNQPSRGAGRNNNNPRPVMRERSPDEKPSAKSHDGTIYEAAGTWNYTLDSPQGGKGVLVLKKDGETYSGTIKSDRMQKEVELTSVTVEGNDFTFTYPVTFGGNTVTVEVKATIEDQNTLKGTVYFGPSRSVPLSGTRAD